MDGKLALTDVSGSRLMQSRIAASLPRLVVGCAQLCMQVTKQVLNNSLCQACRHFRLKRIFKPAGWRRRRGKASTSRAANRRWTGSGDVSTVVVKNGPEVFWVFVRHGVDNTRLSVIQTRSMDCSTSRLRRLLWVERRPILRVDTFHFAPRTICTMPL